MRFVELTAFTSMLFSATVYAEVPETEVTETERRETDGPHLEWEGFKFFPIAEVSARAELRRNPMNDGIFGEHPVLRDDLPTSSRSPVVDHFLVWERLRLGLSVERGPVTARVAVQDVRMFGNGATTRWEGQPDLPLTGPSEAYVELHTDERDVWFRLGRQPVTLGDGRLIGASDRFPTGRQLDAARFFARVGDFDLGALAALLVAPGETTQEGETWLAPGAQLFALSGLWHAHPLAKVELMAIGRTVREPIVSSVTPSDTILGSARVFGRDRGLSYSAILAVEGGQVALRNQPDPASHFAYAGAFRLDWETALPLRLTFGAEGAYASGGPQDGDAIGLFDPLLPDSSTGFGPHDFFAWSNLIEAGADVAIRPVDELFARIGYRWVGLADPEGPWFSSSLFPIGQSSTNTSHELGHLLVTELEATPWEVMSFGLNFGFLIFGEGATNIFEDSRKEQVDAPDVGMVLGLSTKFRVN